MYPIYLNLILLTLWDLVKNAPREKSHLRLFWVTGSLVWIQALNIGINLGRPEKGTPDVTGTHGRMRKGEIRPVGHQNSLYIYIYTHVANWGPRQDLGGDQSVWNKVLSVSTGKPDTWSMAGREKERRDAGERTDSSLPWQLRHLEAKK